MSMYETTTYLSDGQELLVDNTRAAQMREGRVGILPDGRCVRYVHFANDVKAGEVLSEGITLETCQLQMLDAGTPQRLTATFSANTTLVENQIGSLVITASGAPKTNSIFRVSGHKAITNQRTVELEVYNGSDIMASLNTAAGEVRLYMRRWNNVGKFDVDATLADGNYELRGVAAADANAGQWGWIYVDAMAYVKTNGAISSGQAVIADTSAPGEAKALGGSVIPRFMVGEALEAVTGDGNTLVKVRLGAIGP